jgi:hypothetical protein
VLGDVEEARGGKGWRALGECWWAGVDEGFDDWRKGAIGEGSNGSGPPFVTECLRRLRQRLLAVFSIDAQQVGAADRRPRLQRRALH